MKRLRCNELATMRNNRYKRSPQYDIFFLFGPAKVRGNNDGGDTLGGETLILLEEYRFEIFLFYFLNFFLQNVSTMANFTH